MATTPKDRMNRLGRPSLAVPLAISAAGALLVIVVLLSWPGDVGEPGAYEGGEAGPAAATARDESIDGQGAEPEGMGGNTDPGVFANAPTPIEEGTNSTSATQGDEMMDLPADPPGGGRVDPDADDTMAAEVAEEEVTDTVADSEVRQATTEGGAQDTDAPSEEGIVTEGAETDGQTTASETDGTQAEGTDGDGEQLDEELPNEPGEIANPQAN